MKIFKIISSMVLLPFAAIGQQKAPPTVVSAIATATAPPARAARYVYDTMRVMTREEKEELMAQAQKAKDILNRPARLAMAEEIAAPSLPRYEYRGKFDAVPLVGDLDYFGKNHAAMVKYTQSYFKSRRKTIGVVKGRASGGKYFVMMDKIMDKYDIPHEMKYLSVIESALNNKALSPVGAYGPWQFMPATGRLMGLTVTSGRDDRADWSRSTHAACKYMTYLYDQLGDWLLVVAAYNSGPRPVLRGIKATGKSDYWAIKSYLPAETQNHVLAFVATATIMEKMDPYIGDELPGNFNWASLNNTKRIGTPKALAPVNPLIAKFGAEEIKKMSVVRIKTPVDLDFLANYLELDRRQLGRWNFDYYDFLDNYNATTSTYNLRLPKEALDKFLEKKDYIERQSAKFMQ